MSELPERKHEPWPGIRIARFCTECQRRQFGDASWTCPEHGARKTITQPNAPYFGQKTT